MISGDMFLAPRCNREGISSHDICPTSQLVVARVCVCVRVCVRARAGGGGGTASAAAAAATAAATTLRNYASTRSWILVASR